LPATWFDSSPLGVPTVEVFGKIGCMNKTASHRRITDAFLLQRLGLSDDSYWDWEAACIEIPEEEIVDSELFDEAMDSLIQHGCREHVLWSCGHYFLNSQYYKRSKKNKPTELSLKLPDKRRLKSLVSTSNVAVRMIDRYENEIITVAEVCGIYPPPWVGDAATTAPGDTSGMSEIFDSLPPANKSVVFVRQLLRWVSRVMTAWQSPNTALLVNATSFPISLYADMVYFDPSLQTYKTKSSKRKAAGTKSAYVAVQKLLTSLKPESTPGPMHRTGALPKRRELNPETLRRNLNNFALRTPKAFKGLRAKLVELHHWDKRVVAGRIHRFPFFPSADE
jgi:hypothetical protein